MPGMAVYTYRETGFNIGIAVVERYDDFCLFDGSAKDYADDLVNETTDIPATLRYCIDYDAIARDYCLL